MGLVGAAGHLNRDVDEYVLEMGREVFLRLEGYRVVAGLVAVNLVFPDVFVVGVYGVVKDVR